MGEDGFLVPLRDAGAAAEKLERLAAEPGQLAAIARRAQDNSAGYTLERYGERLIAAFRERGVI